MFWKYSCLFSNYLLLKLLYWINKLKLKKYIVYIIYIKEWIKN